MDFPLRVAGMGLLKGSLFFNPSSPASLGGRSRILYRYRMRNLHIYGSRGSWERRFRTSQSETELLVPHVVVFIFYEMRFVETRLKISI